MCETALTSLGRLEIQKIVREAGPRAKLLQGWLRNPDRILVVTLVANNIANIVASSLVTLWAEQYYPLYFSLNYFTIAKISSSRINCSPSRGATSTKCSARLSP